MRRIIRISMTVIIILLLALYAIRLKDVNSDLKLSKVEVYEKGEKVPYGKDFCDISVYGCEGYSMQVLDNNVYTCEEFCKKYDISDLGEYYYDYFYTVDVKIYNDNTETDTEHGLTLPYIYLRSVNDYVVTNSELSVEISSLPGSSFSLRPESNMDITLVYGMNAENYSGIKEIRDTEYTLMITEYPTEKLLKI